MSRTHLWQGRWLDDASLIRALPDLRGLVDEAVAASLPLSVLLDAAEGLRELLVGRERLYFDLMACLEAAGVSSHEATATLDQVGASLARPALEARRVEGLGLDDAMVAPRASWHQPVFSTWAPLGLMVMLVPRHPLWVGVEAALDALLAGNACLLRSWPGDWQFSQRVLQALVECDATGLLRGFIYVACLAPGEKEPLRSILSVADGVAAWGDARTLAEIRAMAPCGVPLVEHPTGLSVAYVGRDRLDAMGALEGVARECCRWEQRAAWSPQVVYVDTEVEEELEQFAVLFGSVMNDASALMPLSTPDPLELATVTTVTENWRLDSTIQDNVGLIEGNDATWRLLIDGDPQPSATPLHRTVRVKPLPEERIVETLRPFARELRAVSVVCGAGSLARLAGLFAAAGARYVATPASLAVPPPFLSTGEAAVLARYTSPLTVVGGEDMRGATTLSELWESPPAVARPFVWSDPRQDARAEARARGHALVAAGLDATRDRCLLLPSADPWDAEEATVRAALDHLGVTWTWPRQQAGDLHLPHLLQGGLDALVGTVEELMDFVDMLSVAEDAPSVRKVFHVGPEPEEGTRILLEQWLGAAHVRSAGYWRPDAGLLGFACVHTPPGVYHLQPGGWAVQSSSIDGAPSPLVFSSLDGEIRVETQDLGHCLFGPCPCGRTGDRFAVLKRTEPDLHGEGTPRG